METEPLDITMIATEELPPEEKLTIRVKCKLSQNLTLRDVSSLMTLDAFLKQLSALTQVPYDEMALLRGFPPKRMAYQFSSTLHSLGIANQDTIIVELDKTGKPGSGSSDTVSRPLPPSTAALSSQHNAAQAPYEEPGSRTVRPAPVVARPLSQTVNVSHGDRKSAMKRSDAGPGRHSNQSNLPPMINQMASDIPIGLTGVVMRKVIPSDNSCLFSAVTFCQTGIENASSADLRELIAQTVLSDPVKYNDGYLGRSNYEYVEWISRFDSWGGGIELAILSAHFAVEINVMDTQHVRVNRFGEDQNYPSCIFLIYDGIHYDALYLECYDGSRIVTTFPVGDTTLFDQVMDLGRAANAAHQFTDVNNFILKCGVCHERFVHADDAKIHAKTTGHQAFAECK